MRLRLQARPRRSLLVGLLLLSAASVAVGWTAGAVSASSGSQPSASSPANANAGALGAAPGVDAIGQVSTQAGAAQGSTGTAIAYPYPIGGSLGIAPEGTILASGSGTADMKVDGSDRAAAMAKATTAAMADARTQAQAVATAMGVSITGTYSVSISASQNYVYPDTVCGVPAPLAPAEVPGSTGGTSTGGATTVTSGPAAVSSAGVCIPGNVVTPASNQLVVTVEVAYRFA
jgi:hypothetical protein